MNIKTRFSATIARLGRSLRGLRGLSYQKFIRKLIIWRYKHLSERQFILLMSVFIGILAGLAAVVLRGFTDIIKLLVNEIFIKGYEFAPYYFALPIIGIIITYIIRRYLISKPMGPGIATILYSISKNKSAMQTQTTYSYLLTAPFTVGFGGSVGLEAPVVGAAIGSNIAKTFHLNRKLHNLFLACATAAALSAIFKVPITGLIFVIELFSIELTVSTLIPLMLSSSIGLIVSYLFLGQGYTFGFAFENEFTFGQLPYYMIMAVGAAIFSVHFTRLHVWNTRFFNERLKHPFIKIAIGGVVLGTLIFMMPALYGEGFSSITGLLSGEYKDSLGFSWLDENTRETMWIVGLIFFGMMYFKSVATTVTFSSGGIGGFFAPSLFLGAIFGFGFASIANSVFPSADLSVTNFTLVGMAAVFSGIIQAPFTAVFLITETTGGYSLALPLILVAATTFFITRKYIGHSVYTESLVRENILFTHDRDKTVLRAIDLDSLIEKDFIPVNRHMTLGELTKEVICKSSRNIFPVVSTINGKLHGVLLLDDIRGIMFEKKYHDIVSIVTLMQEPADIIVKGQDTTQDIVRKFSRTNSWNLPVVDEQGVYVGFVSKSKLLSKYRRMICEFETENMLFD